MVFYVNGEGFLNPAKLRLENVFDNKSDYVVNGSIL